MKKKERAPDPEWDPVHWRNYESRLFDTRAWLRRSEELFAAAKLNEPKIAEHWKALREFRKTGWVGDRRLRDDVIGIYFMLVAYAVENLLKGALIEQSQPRRGPIIYRELSKLHQEFTKSGKLPESIKSHDLFLLAKRAGISCSTEEEDLLRRLTRAAEWAGRYPVPIEFNQMSGAEFFSDGKQYLLSVWFEDDPARIGRLWRKLRDELLVSPSRATETEEAAPDVGGSAMVRRRRRSGRSKRPQQRSV